MRILPWLLERANVIHQCGESQDQRLLGTTGTSSPVDEISAFLEFYLFLLVTVRHWSGTGYLRLASKRWAR